MVDIKQPPYYSTFNEDRKEYRILARPGRPVQVREWNDLQEQIQNQIQKVGAHLFENGAQVLPGTDDAVTYRNNIGFIKIPASPNAEDEAAIQNLWLGKDIISTSAPIGVKAKVIGYRTSDTLGEVRLFVDYTQADDTDGEATSFIPGQDIETVEITPSTSTIESVPTAVGKCSGVFIKKSVYFFNGNFLLVDEQSIFLNPIDESDQDAWTPDITAKVGLNVIESVVTFSEDESLGDNANSDGAENFGAPGADRLKIECFLEQRDYNEQNDGKFIELLRVSNGVVQSRVNKTAYSVIADTMARRTYDESGHYTVKDFPLTIKPFLIEDDNGGVHPREEFQYPDEASAEAAGLLLFGVAGASLDPEVLDKWLPASSYEEFLRLARGKLTLQIDPGKAYVKGYEIEKLAPTFVDIDKSRSLRFQNNRTVSTTLGSYIYVKGVYGSPEVELYEEIEIHRKAIATPGVSPSAKIGTARILAIEYFSGTHGTADAVYKLFMFDVQGDPGFDLAQMKSVVSTTGSTFTADIVQQYAPLEGSVTADGSNTITGYGTSFVNRVSQQLSPFDTVRIGNDDSQIFEVDVVNSDTEFEIQGTASFAGNQTIEVAFAVFEGLNDLKGLVFPLPDQYAYTIRGANSDNSINDTIIDTFFSVRRTFLATSDGFGRINIMTVLANEEFEDYSPIDYIAVNLDTSTWLQLVSGNSFSGGNSGVEQISSTQMRIHADPADAGDQYYIIATVRKTQGIASKEKTKTAHRGSFEFGAYTGPSISTSANSSDLSQISLEEADILKVTRIVMSPDFTIAPSDLEVLPSGHRDITDRYLLDNGQRDYYYDTGSVYLKPGAERPTGRVRVEFDYFEHSTQGSYFSVDSYPFKGPSVSMDYAEIPQFTDSSGHVYELRDVLDFRPRRNPDGTFANYIEVPRSNVRCDLHHYLHRTDNLYLDPTGLFRVVQGTPDVDPLAPEAPGDAMSIYEIDLQAYTATPEQAFKRKIDNRRFTMRDIGRLQARVENIEQTVVLSLVEKETSELEILDAQGLPRFKNGFIVDSFKDHGIGDIGDTDYRCSVDSINQQLRPIINQHNVSLIEKNSLIANPVLLTQAREDANYTRTGKIFTLPYSPAKFIEQGLASQVENINPYAKFTFRGRITLDPSTDTWRDTEKLPVLEVYDDSAYQAALVGVNPNEVVYGEWEKNWTQVDVSKKKLPSYTTYGPNPPDAVHSGKWPRYVKTPTKVTTTTTTQEIRKGIQTTIADAGVKTQSLGSRIVQTIAADYIRDRDVTITGYGFMPGALLYAFFDGQAVGSFCNPNSLGYGQPIRADSKGTVSLIFSIPKGRFLTGERIFKLTTNPTNANNPQPASEGEAKYYAVGWIDKVQETELSIRQFEVQRTEVEDTRFVSSTKTTTTVKTVREDPIAQSFAINEKGGCFLLAVDVFFLSKDPNIPVKLQLRPLSDDGYPTNKILFGGEVVKPAADVIVNTVDLTTGQMTVTGHGTIPGYTIGPFDGSTSNPIEIQRVKAVSGRTIPNGTPFSLGNVVNDMIPTRFIFETPPYVQEGNSYAIVLLADSIEYQAWVAQSGPVTARPGGAANFDNGTGINTIIGTSTPILKDNFLDGVFFRSSNGETWNADQLIDMKFAVHKCSFLTNETGLIEYVNEQLPGRILDNDPIVTFEGSRKIRVRHRNHGHPANASPPPRVVLSGVTTANGLELAVINRVEGHPIESIELDSYVIDLVDSADPADLSGRTGGVGIVASENKSLDTMFFNANVLTFPECEIDWSISTTNGGNVSYQDPKNIPFVINPYLPVPMNQTVDFKNPMTISSAINENTATDPIVGPSKVNVLGDVGERKSMRLKAVIRSFNPNLSPVLDADRLAIIGISNRLNNPVGSGIGSINIAEDVIAICPTTAIPAVASAANKITFNNATEGADRGKFTTDDADLAQHLSKLDVGKLVTISGTTSSLRDCTDAVVLAVRYTPDDSIKCTVILDHTFGGSTGLEAAALTLTQKDNFVDEIAPSGGSAAFKYITKQLPLARPSTALQVMLDAYRNDSEEWAFYYRILRTDETRSIEDINWTKMEFNLTQNGELVPATPQPSDADTQFISYSATVNGLPPFTGVQIKLVGLGGNSAKPPKGSNLKAIAIDE